MAKSEAAKALEAKNKEEIRRRKEAKKNSDNPRDWGIVKQLRFSYSETKKYDPQLPLWLALSIIGPFLGVLLIGVLFVTLAKWPWWQLFFFGFLGLMVGFLVGTNVLGSRAKKSMYKRYDGEAGSAEVALRELDAKKWVTKPVVMANRNYDAVHRALGPAGLILIGEGEPGRTKQLLAQEVKRHEQVAYGVKVQTVMMGDKPGQVPLSQLSQHLKKLPKQLSDAQVKDVAKRLTALDAVRQRGPVPKGPMPTRPPSRRSMRGR